MGATTMACGHTERNGNGDRRCVRCRALDAMTTDGCAPFRKGTIPQIALAGEIRTTLLRRFRHAADTARQTHDETETQRWTRIGAWVRAQDNAPRLILMHASWDRLLAPYERHTEEPHWPSTRPSYGTDSSNTKEPPSPTGASYGSANP